MTYDHWKTTEPDPFDGCGSFKCAECDGEGEWDEGPINARGSPCEPADPEYRRVICPECEGTGRVVHKARTPIADAPEDEIKF